MKKHIVIALLSMMISVVPVSASSTMKRSLPEFCELYAYRMEALSDFEPSSSYFIYDLSNEAKLVSLSSGNVIVDPESLDINEATVVIHDFNAADDENIKNVTNFMAAASALEWSALEGRVNILVDPVEEGKNLYYNDLAPALLEIMKDDSFYDGNEVLIYSGNYDYYVQYEKYGEGDNTRIEVWCNMRARKE